MNINLFFTGIIGGLLAIFLLFNPLDIKKQTFDEIPVFELESFKLIELDDQGLTTVMNGIKGIRFSDRYLVYDIDYTDNTKKYLANMKADRGLYKGTIIDLNGNIKYQREDGISFFTQKAIYDKETSIVLSSTEYVAYIQDHKIIGSHIEYNNDLDTLKSKNITVNYKLKERRE